MLIFPYRAKSQRTCSYECYLKWLPIRRKERRSKKPILNCLQCDKVLPPRGKKFCNHKCQGKFFSGENNPIQIGSDAYNKMVNAINTPEMKERKKIIAIQTGFQKGQIPWNKKYFKPLGYCHCGNVLMNPKSKKYCSYKCYWDDFMESHHDVSQHYKSGWFWSDKNQKNMFYRSSYELIAMKFFETMSSVFRYEYETLSIPYIDKNNKPRRTIPDFLVYYTDGTKQIIEIKPLFKIKNNLFNTVQKMEVTKEFAKQNNMSYAVWTEKELGLDQY
jgi:hypothetical protein